MAYYGRTRNVNNHARNIILQSKKLFFFIAFIRRNGDTHIASEAYALSLETRSLMCHMYHVWWERGLDFPVSYLRSMVLRLRFLKLAPALMKHLWTPEPVPCPEIGLWSIHHRENVQFRECSPFRRENAGFAGTVLTVVSGAPRVLLLLAGHFLIYRD